MIIALKFACKIVAFFIENYPSYDNLIEYAAPINLIKLNLSVKNNSTFNLKMRKKIMLWGAQKLVAPFQNPLVAFQSISVRFGIGQDGGGFGAW